MSADALACVRCGTRVQSAVASAGAEFDGTARTLPMNMVDPPARRSVAAHEERAFSAAGAAPRVPPRPPRGLPQELRSRSFWIVAALVVLVLSATAGGSVWQGWLPWPRNWLDVRVTAWIVLHAGAFLATAVAAGAAAVVLPGPRRPLVWSPLALSLAAAWPSLALPWSVAWLVRGLVTLPGRVQMGHVPAPETPSHTETLLTRPTMPASGWTWLVLGELAAGLAVAAALMWPAPWRAGLPPRLDSAIRWVQEAAGWLPWTLAAIGIGHLVAAGFGSFWETYREGGLLAWLSPSGVLAPGLVFVSAAILTGLGRDVAGPDAIDVGTALRDSVLFWSLPSLYGLYYVVMSWAAMQRHVAQALIGYVLCGPIVVAGWRTARVETHRQQCSERLATLAAGLRQYAETYRELPPPWTTDSAGQPLLSWRVLVLPYIGEAGLYQQFDLAAAWDAPQNVPLLDRRPELFACDELDWDDRRSTLCAGVVGDETLFPPTGGVSVSDLFGPGADTLLLVELAETSRLPWTAPRDVNIADLELVARSGDRESAALAVTVQGERAALRPERASDGTATDLGRRFRRPSVLNH